MLQAKRLTNWQRHLESNTSSHFVATKTRYFPLKGEPTPAVFARDKTSYFSQEVRPSPVVCGCGQNCMFLQDVGPSQDVFVAQSSTAVLTYKHIRTY